VSTPLLPWEPGLFGIIGTELSLMDSPLVFLQLFVRQGRNNSCGKWQELRASPFLPQPSGAPSSGFVFRICFALVFVFFSSFFFGFFIPSGEVFCTMVYFGPSFSLLNIMMRSSPFEKKVAILNIVSFARLWHQKRH
jgi:hypothetical protein